MTDERVVAAPARRAVRRRRWVVFVCLGVFALGVGDGWLWFTHAGRTPLSPAPVAAEPPVARVPVVTATSTGPATSGPTPTRPAAARPTVPLALTAPPTVDAAWVARVAARTGIPSRALTAYADAQLDIGASEPGCHVTWTMLAGIGVVESSHGSSGGSRLRADGTTSRTILGPALDGTHGNVALRATAAGIRLDGDTRWDHAIGPMQFIPSTWTRWGASPDSSTPNPNDIDDAALTAARYLCAAGGDLSTAKGWHAAVSAYNAPALYLLKVTDWANTYAKESGL